MLGGLKIEQRSLQSSLLEDEAEEVNSQSGCWRRWRTGSFTIDLVICLLERTVPVACTRTATVLMDARLFPLSLGGWRGPADERAGGGVERGAPVPHHEMGISKRTENLEAQNVTKRQGAWPGARRGKFAYPHVASSTPKGVILGFVGAAPPPPAPAASTASTSSSLARLQ